MKISKIQEKLEEYLVKQALKNDDATYLMKKTLDFLTQKRVIFPSLATLEDLVIYCRDKAEYDIFSGLIRPLTNEQFIKLDDLLNFHNKSPMTKLSWIKDLPGKANPESFLNICKKIEVISSLNLATIDVSHIHRNRFMQLARLGDNYNAYDFSRFN